MLAMLLLLLLLLVQLKVVVPVVVLLWFLTQPSTEQSRTTLCRCLLCRILSNPTEKKILDTQQVPVTAPVPGPLKILFGNINLIDVQYYYVKMH